MNMNRADLFTSPKISRPSWAPQLLPLEISAGVALLMWVSVSYSISQSHQYSGDSPVSVLLPVTCILLAVGALMGLPTLDMFMPTAPEGLPSRGVGFCISS